MTAVMILFMKFSLVGRPKSRRRAGTRQRKKVLLIYTGGTIGMEMPRRVPRHAPAALRRRLRERVPELESLAQCDVEVLFNRDSAHVGPDEWIRLAAAIRGRWKRYDGVVVLHGTDTLAYTACALSFLLRPCLRPVVLTGSQRPLAALRTDARRNLVSAVEIAAHGPRPGVNRVSVFFDDKLFQGNRVRKRSASEFGAFESPVAPPLARVGTEIRYDGGALRSLRAGPRLAREAFSSRVPLLHVTPGFPAAAVAERLLADIDALVLVTFGSGTGPTHEAAFLGLLREARRRGVPVVAVSGGEADPAAYPAGRALLELGCHWAGGMTAECAYVKAALLAAQPGGARAFARAWKRVLAGER
jgi:L-asparaginase